MSRSSQPSAEETISGSASETRALGRSLARKLGNRACIALIGNLGAGKTTFVKGIAEELGVDPDEVVSPTFVLIREYEGRVPLIHADAYRTERPEEFVEVGLAEYFERPGIVAIEWGEKLDAMLPESAITVEIEILADNRRKISIGSDGG